MNPGRENVRGEKACDKERLYLYAIDDNCGLLQLDCRLIGGPIQRTACLSSGMREHRENL